MSRMTDVSRLVMPSIRPSRVEGITSLETSVILDVVKFSYEWEIA